MNRNKLKKNSGITLIALVITIIVMLVLVAVTISMAVNGGLFDYAGKAVGDTEKARDEEQEIANLEANMTVDQLINKFTGGNNAGGGLPAYSEDLLDSETKVLTDKATYTTKEGGKTYTAVIPKGFAISNVADEQTIVNGLVITDKVDSDGNSVGNEFVWIPVEKAIVTEAEIAKIKENSNDADMTSLEAVQSLVNSGTYPMAVQDGTNYKGILYDFTHNEDNTLTVTVKDWNNTDSNREPANLKNKYYVYSTSSHLEFNYDSQEAFTKHGLGTYSNTLYQEAFNKMVKSVADNSGFYVGRYEISNDDGLDYVETKKDKTALVSTTWYEMYKLERAYAQNNTALGVTSEMIWGSQWDQMMLFVNGKNDGRATPDPFYVEVDVARKSGDSSTKTGMNTKGGDEVANIFDLEASRVEWTQEALSPFTRATRGGSYCDGDEASYRNGKGPSYSDSIYSSRAALYLQ